MLKNTIIIVLWLMMSLVLLRAQENIKGSDSLFFEARHAARQFQHDKATTLYQQAAEGFLSDNNLKKYHHILNYWGIDFTGAGWTDEGEKILLKALDFGRNQWSEDAFELRATYLGLGRLHMDKGAFRQGKAYLEKALAAHQKKNSQDDETLAHIYNQLGRSYKVYGDNEKAKQYYDQALNIFQNRNNFAGMARVLRNIALAQDDWCGDSTLFYFNQAQNVLMQDSSQENQLMNKVGLSNILAGLAECQLYSNNYHAARELLESLLQMTRGLIPETNPENIRRNVDLAESYRALGETEKALALHQTILAWRKQSLVANDPWIGNSYMALGNLYSLQNQPADAIAYYQKAFSFKRNPFAAHMDEIYGWINMGKAYGQLGEHEPGMLYLKKALDKIDQLYVSVPENKAIIYTEMATILDKQGKKDQALNSLQKGLFSLDPLTDTTNLLLLPPVQADMNFPPRLEILRKRALRLQEMSKQAEDTSYVEAIWQTYMHADSFIDLMRNRFIYEESRSHLSEYALPIYENAISFLVECYERDPQEFLANQLLAWMEKSKALRLQESLEKDQAAHNSGLNEGLINFDTQLKSQMLAVRRKINEQENLGKYRDAAQLESLQDQYHALLLRRDSFQHVLANQYPEYFKLRYAIKPVNLREVRSQLNEDEVLLSWFWGEKIAVLLSTSKDEWQIYPLMINDGLINRMDTLRKLLYRSPTVMGNADKWQSAFNQFRQISHQLFQQLLQAIDLPAEAHTLIIIPDGPLSYLPLEVLLTKADPKAKSYKQLPYLFHLYPVRYMYSARQLIGDRERNQGPSIPYVGFAPDYDESNTASFSSLSFNREEIESGSALYGGRLFTADHASEQSFYAYAPGARILHLATHGIADDDDPWNSRFVFADRLTEKEDGKLYAHELLGLNLNADLAILSACHSGYGPLKRSEGIQSMASAFATAGCKALVMSLWQNDDKASSEIIGRFFSYLHQGIPQNEALKRAKQDYISAAPEARSHPAYWANLIHLGANNPLIPANNEGRWLALIIFLLALTLTASRLLS